MTQCLFVQLQFDTRHKCRTLCKKTVTLCNTYLYVIYKHLCKSLSECKLVVQKSFKTLEFPQIIHIGIK